MSDAVITTIHAAQDAAEALIALGWLIQPCEADLGHWHIKDLILTDEELIGLATRRGIRPREQAGAVGHGE